MRCAKGGGQSGIKDSRHGEMSWDGEAMEKGDFVGDRFEWNQGRGY